MKKLTKIITLILVAVVSFYGIIAAGTEDTYAASVKSPARVTGLTVKAYSAAKIKLSWRRINRNCRGYAIVRNGKVIRRVGKNNTVFYDAAKAGTTYRYKIRAYNTYTIRQYYNSSKKSGRTKSRLQRTGSAERREQPLHTNMAELLWQRRSPYLNIK